LFTTFLFKVVEHFSHHVIVVNNVIVTAFLFRIHLIGPVVVTVIILFHYNPDQLVTLNGFAHFSDIDTVVIVFRHDFVDLVLNMVDPALDVFGI